MALHSELQLSLLRMLLRPVIRFSIRYALKIQDVTEVSKALFAELAQEHLQQAQEKATDSRICVMTGLHRRDISRLLKTPTPPAKAQDILSKVFGQWMADKRFLDRSGAPRLLSYGSEKSDFTLLVSLVTNDVTPAAVLSELERLNSVRRTPKGLELAVNSFVPKGDPVQGFKILSDDISDLVLSVEENVISGATPPNMHFRTEYDRIDPSAIAEIRKWFLERGRELHMQARNYLSKFDLDINPERSTSETPARVTLSSHSFTETNSSQELRESKMLGNSGP